MTFWFGFLVLFVVGSAVAGVVKIVQGSPDYTLFLMPVFGIGMMLAGVAMTSFGRHGMGERDQREIVEHIERHCSARLVERPDDSAIATHARVMFRKPAASFDRLAGVFSGGALRRLFSTRHGIALLITTTAAQLPAFETFRRGAECQSCPSGVVAIAWGVGAVATVFGFIGMVAVAEDRPTATLRIALVQVCLAAASAWLLWSVLGDS